jgi:LuxR family maltose regulon positive regulatory protein
MRAGGEEAYMVGLAGRALLLPTPTRKTSPPDSKSLNIWRQGLITRLQRDRRELTLIQGAAGSGKTVLAAQWASELCHPVAWVTLDPTDNDPVVLISALMNALLRAGIDVGWDAGPLTSDEPTYSRSVVPHFLICISSQAVPFTLVLDDVHEVKDPRAVWMLRSALESLPSDSHGIVVGRTLEALPVASWISGDRAVLLADSALAMNAREVAQLLTGLGGVTPDKSAVSDLLAATHGWPIAVYLGSRMGQSDRLGNVTYFSAFLDQEVLRGADAETVRLLKATSGLLDLSAELCDFVLRQERSADLLERAERASLLVTRSRDHAWFRVHPLLREHLQARLLQEDPSLCRTVARRASEWSMARGHTDSAITYARESADLDLLGATIWAGAAEALTTGQAQRVVGWLGAVDDATIAKSCPMAMSAAWCAINRGQSADAYRWSQVAFGAADKGWESNLHRSSLEAGLALLLSTSGSLGYESSAALAGQAARSLPSDHVTVPYAHTVAGWMHVLGGAWDVGTEELRRSAQLAHSKGLLGTEVEAQALLGIALLSRDDDKGAEFLVRGALDTWEQGGIQHFLAAGALIAGPASLMAARSGQRERAKAQLAQVEESVTMFGPILPWLVPILESFSAAAHALLGDHERAGRYLEAAVEATARVPGSTLLTNLLERAQSTVEGESHLSGLSPAERRVFERLLTRATLREIADALCVSPETVKTQTGSIYRKLDVSSRREVQELGDRLRVTPVPRTL